MPICTEISGGLYEVRFIRDPTRKVTTSCFYIVTLDNYHLIIDKSKKDSYPSYKSLKFTYTEIKYIPCSIEVNLGTSTTSSSSSKESMPFLLNPFENSSGNPKSSSSSGGKSGKPSSSSNDYPKSSSSKYFFGNKSGHHLNNLLL